MAVAQVTKGQQLRYSSAEPEMKKSTMMTTMIMKIMILQTEAQFLSPFTIIIFATHFIALQFSQLADHSARRDCLKVLKTADFPPQTPLTDGHTQNGSGVSSVHTAQKKIVKASRSHRLRAHRSAMWMLENWNECGDLLLHTIVCLFFPLSRLFIAAFTTKKKPNAAATAEEFKIETISMCLTIWMVWRQAEMWINNTKQNEKGRRMSSSCDERRWNTKQKEEKKSFPIFSPSNFLFFPMMFLEFQFSSCLSPPVGRLLVGGSTISVESGCVGLGQFTDCSKYFYPIQCRVLQRIKILKIQSVNFSSTTHNTNLCVHVQLLKPKMNSAMHVKWKREMENYFDNKFSSISIFRQILRKAKAERGRRRNEIHSFQAHSYEIFIFAFFSRRRLYIWLFFLLLLPTEWVSGVSVAGHKTEHSAELEQ